MEGTTTMNRRFACTTTDLDPGESMTLPGEAKVALHRSEDGEFFATADSCSHEEWSLGEDSDIEGDEVVCPLHMARFSLRTGAALCFPATIALQTYAVEVDGEDVYVVG